MDIKEIVRIYSMLTSTDPEMKNLGASLGIKLLKDSSPSMRDWISNTKLEICSDIHKWDCMLHEFRVLYEKFTRS